MKIKICPACDAHNPQDNLQCDMCDQSLSLYDAVDATQLVGAELEKLMPDPLHIKCTYCKKPFIKDEISLIAVSTGLVKSEETLESSYGGHGSIKKVTTTKITQYKNVKIQLVSICNSCEKDLKREKAVRGILLIIGTIALVYLLSQSPIYNIVFIVVYMAAVYTLFNFGNFLKFIGDLFSIKETVEEKAAYVRRIKERNKNYRGFNFTQLQ